MSKNLKYKYEIKLNYQRQIYKYNRWAVDDVQALVLGVIALEKELGRTEKSLLKYFLDNKPNFEVKRI
jgi:hypothetical protein